MGYGKLENPTFIYCVSIEDPSKRGTGFPIAMSDYWRVTGVL